MKKGKGFPVPRNTFEGEVELGGMKQRSDAIGVNRLETPARERIGTSTMPVPCEGAGNGGPEFRFDTHPASGSKRRRG